MPDRLLITNVDHPEHYHHGRANKRRRRCPECVADHQDGRCVHQAGHTGPHKAVSGHRWGVEPGR